MMQMEGFRCRYDTETDHPLVAFHRNVKYTSFMPLSSTKQFQKKISFFPAVDHSPVNGYS